MRLLPSFLPHYSRHRHGFTMIELAIVLIVIGLLIGGVLAGRNLIHVTQLRSVTDEATTYAVAIQQFRDKYSEMPGDFSGATNIWGFAGTTAIPGCVSKTGITAISAQGTCDGNGDGKYRYATPLSDGYAAWQHLMLAGYIKGSYSGVGAPPVLGSNVPSSAVGNAGWSLAYADASDFADGGPNYWGFQSIGNVLFFGAVTSDVTRAAAISPSDALSIDSKFDDGLPGTGAILGEKPASGTCFDTTVTPISYKQANTKNVCALRFMLDRFKSTRKY